MSNCLSCGKTPKRNTYTYCSNKCQKEFEYKEYIKKWKIGLVSGNRGINTKNISQYIKRYLIEEFGEQCMLCGWDERHPLTNHVPLEVDHINGNADETTIKNIRLICPNCHSLSLNFRNFNKGKGRSWRTKKYLKTKDKLIAELAE